MLKLYGTSRSRASRSILALEELGLAYEHVPFGRELYEPLKNALKSRIKDSTLLMKQIRKLDSLRATDSLAAEYQHRVDRILSITASMNVPVGWDPDAAPLSWFGESTSWSRKPTGMTNIAHANLIAYADRRNQWSFRNFVLYVIGIVISGVSLSFGAPFWFETLVKLINIRRAGRKPETANAKK